LGNRKDGKKEGTCMALQLYGFISCEHLFIGRYPSFDYKYCYGASPVIYACSSTILNSYSMGVH